MGPQHSRLPTIIPPNNSFASVLSIRCLELLPRYAWYIDNARDRTWPAGQKRPNDLGLFDSLGNVWNWTQDSDANYPCVPAGAVVEDRENTDVAAPEAGDHSHGSCALNGNTPVSIW